MNALRAAGLEDATRAAATDGRPFLGICIGMQMLFDGSDETPDIKGIGIIPGRVTLLPRSVRLPQMGWNTLEIASGSRLGADLPDPAWLYFVHSFAPEPTDPSVVSAWCDYGRRFAAAVEVGPVWATQFHPEKSGAVGLQMLRNFVDAISSRVDALMDLFPSIDLRAGQVVRLARGDYSAQTTYDDDPVAVARRFDAAGARWIHVVDLDAALEGGNPNLAMIEAICANVGAQVQTGGGVRSVNDASERFAAGVTARGHRQRGRRTSRSCQPSSMRCTPDRLRSVSTRRGRDVAIHGWTDATGLDLISSRASSSTRRAWAH